MKIVTHQGPAVHHIALDQSELSRLAKWLHELAQSYPPPVDDMDQLKAVRDQFLKAQHRGEIGATC